MRRIEIKLTRPNAFIEFADTANAGYALLLAECNPLTASQSLTFSSDMLSSLTIINVDDAQIPAFDAMVAKHQAAWDFEQARRVSEGIVETRTITAI
jgi:hypothetical protein